MSTLVTYKAIDGGDVHEVSPDPVAVGGLALNTNFRAIADSLPRNNYGAATNPAPDNDSVDTAGIGVDFSQGSRWYNGTAIFECVDPTPTAAVWVAVAPGATPTLDAVLAAGATTSQVPTFNVGINTGQINDLSGIAFSNDISISLEDGPQLRINGGYLNMMGNDISGVGTLSAGTLNIGGIAISTDDGPQLQINSLLNMTGHGIFGVSDLEVGSINIAVEDGSLNLNGRPINAGSGATLQADGSGNWIIGGQLVNVVIDNQSSAPGSPVAGQIYYNTGNGHFYGWNGTAWKQLDN